MIQRVFANEAPTLTTRDIAKRLDVSQYSVIRWMEVGVTIKGRLVRLAFRRIGTKRKATESWLKQFLDDCNADSPPTVETTSERQRRVDKDVADLKRELAR